MARMRFDQKDNMNKQNAGPFSPGSSVVIRVKNCENCYTDIRGIVVQVISEQQIVVNTTLGHLLANIADCKPYIQ